MKKNTLFWIVGILLLVIVLLYIPSIFMNGRYSRINDGYGMHDGFGMMDGYGIRGGYGMLGGGWMAFGWIIPIVIMILVIAAGVWLGNTLSSRTHVRTCPNCGKPAKADWQTCPHCSTSL